MNALFINLSNHPSSKWSPLQLEAAMDMVDRSPVIDMAFPNIKPEMTTKEVQNLANEYIDKIKNLINEYDAEKVVLHVMGEMTFTYHIAFSFRLSPIVTCVASTTKRNVIEKNGEKISIFEFVQFRKY
jgi:hypothetical protein